MPLAITEAHGKSLKNQCLSIACPFEGTHILGCSKGSHFLGSWLLCIPSQVSQPHLSHEQQSKYLLRALGALRLLRSRQRIVPDEAAYRALMVACGRTRNDRRTELVRLFGLLRSDGIFPSAMTLGQYTRALAEGYSKRATGTPEEDVAGVEVTESASKDLRVGAVRTGAMDAEVALSALDGTLANLEEAGRRWRQKNAPEKDTGQPGDDKSASNDSKSAPMERQKKRISHKPWLPVVFSSSFVPAKLLVSGTQQTRPLRATDIRLIAIWSRTKSCDCKTWLCIKWLRTLDGLPVLTVLLLPFNLHSVWLHTSRRRDSGWMGRRWRRKRHPRCHKLPSMWVPSDPYAGLQGNDH